MSKSILFTSVSVPRQGESLVVSSESYFRLGIGLARNNRNSGRELGAAKAKKSACGGRVQFMQNVVKPRDVIVIDDMETMVNSVWFHFVAKGFEHLLKFVLSSVGSPGIDPVLDDLFAKFALQIICLLEIGRNLLLSTIDFRAHPSQIANSIIKMDQDAIKERFYEWALKSLSCF